MHKTVIRVILVMCLLQLLHCMPLPSPTLSSFSAATAFH